MIFRQSNCVAKLSFRISPRWPPPKYQIFTGLTCVSILNTAGEKRHVRRLPHGRTRERLVGCRARTRFYDTTWVCNSGGVQKNTI